MLSGTHSSIFLPSGGTLLAKINAKDKNSLVLTWNETKGAEGYDIFFIKCGKEAPKKVKTIKGNKTFKWTKTSLKKKTPYKAVVKAYVAKNGKKTYAISSAKKGKKSFKKYFKINKTTGKVTVKKGLKKGTYKVKVKVKALGNSNYKASGQKTVTFTVKVK